MKKIKGSAKLSSSKAGSSTGMQSKTGNMNSSNINPAVHASQNMQPRPKTQINGQRGTSQRTGDARLISSSNKDQSHLVNPHQ